ARLGRWTEAADDFAAALKGAARHETFDWQHALLLARAGRVDACRRLGEDILGRLPEAADVDGLAKAIAACPVLPGPVRAPGRLVRLEQQPPSRGSKHRGVPWFHHVAAIACFRAGRYAEAIRRSETSEQGFLRDKGWVRARTANWLVLALAHHRMGNK